MLRSGSVRIVGTGLTKLGKLGKSASSLMQEALESALGSAGLPLSALDGLVAVPSLSHPHFMEAHYLATRVGLLPHKDVLVRTIDTGGAGPVSGLITASRMVQLGQCKAVAVVAGDAVASMDTADFLERADSGCADPAGSLPSPVIPNGYDRVARWQQRTYGLRREQLAMVSVLMSHQASAHPLALTRTPHTLEEVLNSRTIAPNTTLLECARRADGGAAVIVADAAFMQEVHADGVHLPPAMGAGGEQAGSRGGWDGGVVMLGGGEASGPLYPPAVIDERMFSCEEAARAAYAEAQLRVQDIDWFGLYDCYPVCFVRAVEAVGLAAKGRGGEWVEQALALVSRQEERLPVNTHGGLMAFGAPWETPAMYNIIEAVEQLRGLAEERQVQGARRALVYGNGGIFSHSAVAILGTPIDR